MKMEKSEFDKINTSHKAAFPVSTSRDFILINIGPKELHTIISLVREYYVRIIVPF